MSDLEEAFKKIETTNLKVFTIICSECGCALNFEEKNHPCEHLLKMAKDWKNI